MNYSILDFLGLLGAVALFLYGMKVMSEGLQKATGDRLRNILSAMTRNRFAGLLTGVVITALIQSSSASTVMVVSFVNAGLMTLGQSMAVIMGANVGTTFTAWIISLFRFLGQRFVVRLTYDCVGGGVPAYESEPHKQHRRVFYSVFALLFLGSRHDTTHVP